MNLTAHQAHLIHVANGTLKSQKALNKITMSYNQWLNCLSYVLAVTDGEQVAITMDENEALKAAVMEEWEEYQLTN